MWVYYIVFYKWYREKDNKIGLASSFFIQLHYAQNKTNSFFFNFKLSEKKYSGEKSG